MAGGTRRPTTGTGIHLQSHRSGGCRIRRRARFRVPGRYLGSGNLSDSDSAAHGISRRPDANGRRPATAYTYADADLPPDIHAHQYPGANSDVHADTHFNPNTDGDGNVHADSDRYGNPLPHGDTLANCDPNIDQHSNPDGGADSHFDRNDAAGVDANVAPDVNGDDTANADLLAGTDHRGGSAGATVSDPKLKLHLDGNPNSVRHSHGYGHGIADVNCVYDRDFDSHRRRCRDAEYAAPD